MIAVPLLGETQLHSNSFKTVTFCSNEGTDQIGVKICSKGGLCFGWSRQGHVLATIKPEEQFYCADMYYVYRRFPWLFID